MFLLPFMLKSLGIGFPPFFTDSPLLHWDRRNGLGTGKVCEERRVSREFPEPVPMKSELSTGIRAKKDLS